MLASRMRNHDRECLSLSGYEIPLSLEGAGMENTEEGLPLKVDCAVGGSDLKRNSTISVHERRKSQDSPGIATAVKSY